MRGFWYFVPKSGVVFIFLSVIFITVWNVYKEKLDFPYVWIFIVELMLFLICFLIASRESDSRRKKQG
jgi:hypothetical protein